MIVSYRISHERILSIRCVFLRKILDDKYTKEQSRNRIDALKPGLLLIFRAGSARY